MTKKGNNYSDSEILTQFEKIGIVSSCFLWVCGGRQGGYVDVDAVHMYYIFAFCGRKGK